MEKLLDLVDISGKAVEKYDDVKTYVSTGAVDTNYIDAEKCEVYSFSNKPSRANLQVNDGDIIFAKMQGTKKTLIIDKENEKYIYSTGFCSIKPKTDRIIEKFLYYLLSSEIFLKEKDKNCTGATQKAITNEGLGKIYIKVPSISDQERLVKLLDRISLINELYNKQITYLDTLIKARFVEMFANKGFNKTQIGNLVDCNIASVKIKLKEEDIINYIDISSIDNNLNIIKKPTTYILKDAPSRAQQVLKTNDILVSTVRPNLKNIAIVDINMDNLIGSSGFCILRPQKCTREYLFYCVLDDDFTKKMVDLASGASYPAIHDDDILNYKVTDAPIKLQSEFSNFVRHIDKLKFA